jgi:hypothetical protein
VSERYPGGIITKSTTTPTGPYQNGTAPGIWTLDQQLQFQQQGIWPTAGLLPNYIEDVFSTYLYTGTGGATTQTINNGIDLSTKGGLVWVKQRDDVNENWLTDTVRGVNKQLISNQTASQYSYTNVVTGFNSNGFVAGGGINAPASTSLWASWTFRKQAKFFDVQTFTSNASRGATVNHSLGVTPSFVIIKCTGATEPWWVWHTSMPSTSYYMILNGTQAQADGGLALTLSSTQVVIPTNYLTNASTSYVMYVFASNAGGFGSAGADNVITCGSYTGNGSATGPTVTLGYEPQWLLIKNTTATLDWIMQDTMRGMSITAGDGAYLKANTTGAEVPNSYITPLATGFQPNQASSQVNASANTYIYIAIRRGPMATPTVGTSVFSPVKGTATTPGFITGFPVDMGILKNYPSGAFDELCTRLLGLTYLTPSSTSAEGADSGAKFDYQNGWYSTLPANTYIGWNFQRAPGFFDVVCYTGDGVSGRAITHNLTVTPELIIVKARNSVRNWPVYPNTLSAGLYLNLTGSFADYGSRFTSVSSTTFGVSADETTNFNTYTYVAYLFATVAGVSKVGSFTGTGGTQTINCGFGAGGARWLMVKRTDSTGNWYVFDSANGFTSSSSPYLLMNSTAAQVTGNNGCYAASTGFTVTSTANATVNINGASYIFLAIA